MSFIPFPGPDRPGHARRDVDVFELLRERDGGAVACCASNARWRCSRTPSPVPYRFSWPGRGRRGAPLAQLVTCAFTFFRQEGIAEPHHRQPHRYGEDTAGGVREDRGKGRQCHPEDEDAGAPAGKDPGAVDGDAEDEAAWDV